MSEKTNKCSLCGAKTEQIIILFGNYYCGKCLDKLSKTMNAVKNFDKTVKELEKEKRRNEK